MADLPIIFSAPMVRALLDGRKTQTRRILKPQPPEWATYCEQPDMLNVLGHWVPSGLWRWCEPESASGEPLRQWPVDADGEHFWLRLRHQSGDRLYVREHWKTMALHDKVSPKKLTERYAGSIYRSAAACPVERIADGSRSGRWASAEEEARVEGWRPGKHRQAMHMPRWASRLTLIVENVRVERLRSISTADVIAEGAPLDPNHRDTTLDGSNPVMCVGDRPWVSQSPHAWLHRLWDSLHGDGAWDANPFVVATTFRVVRGNIDSLEQEQAA